MFRREAVYENWRVWQCSRCWIFFKISDVAQSIKTQNNVLYWAIWYYLFNFKNVKNTHGRVWLLVKLQAFSITYADSASKILKMNKLYICNVCYFDMFDILYYKVFTKSTKQRIYAQKQPTKGVLSKTCSENMSKI